MLNKSSLWVWNWSEYLLLTFVIICLLNAHFIDIDRDVTKYDLTMNIGLVSDIQLLDDGGLIIERSETCLLGFGGLHR